MYAEFEDYANAAVPIGVIMLQHELLLGMFRYLCVLYVGRRRGKEGRHRTVK
jgi:hypothetical protein